MNLICEVLFLYRYLPIEEKKKTPLCDLSASVVNPGRLRRRRRPWITNRHEATSILQTLRREPLSAVGSSGREARPKTP